jgi:hypothetical protein
MAIALNYRVQISPLSAVGATDSPSVGLFGGVLTWVTGYDSTYNSSNSSADILSEDWSSVISKSAIVTRSGNTSTYSGGQIKVVGTSALLDILDARNITLYKAIITIAESRDDGPYTVIRTGIVAQNQNEITEHTIPFSDITKGYSTTLAKEILDSGEIHPVNFGLSDRSKTVKVSSDFDIPLLGGRVPVFEVVPFGIGFDNIPFSIPYSDQPTSIEFSDWIDAVNALIESGKNIAIVQGSKKRIIREVGPSGGAVDGIFLLRYGDDKSDPIIDSSDVSDYILLEPIGDAYYTDHLAGQYNSSELSSYIDGEYQAFPQFIDQTTFNTDNVEIVDEDGSGWVHLTDNQTPTGVTGSLPTTVIRTITGDLSALADGDPNTFVNINLTGTIGIDQSAITEFLGFKVESQDALEEVVVAGVIKFSNRIADDNHTRQIGVYGKLTDQFGKDDYSTNTFEVITGTSGDIMTNPIPTLYNNNPTLDEREGFLYGSDAVIPDAGVERLFVFNNITTSVQFKAGLDCTLIVDLYDPSQLGEDLDIDIQIYDLRVFARSGYSTDEIYVDWQGRNNYENTDYIKTLPEVHEHAIQMQDYSNRGVSVPVGGWGINYPAVGDWTQYYDESTDYGGLFSANLNQDITSFQILDAAKMRTEAIKKECARHLWAISAIDRDGIEKLYPMVAGLQNDDGAIIRYSDLIKGRMPTFKDRLYSDIFTAPFVSYFYDAGSDKNTKSIAITQVEAAAYDPAFVTGVTNPAVAAELWGYANVLYKVYQISNPYPTALSSCPWFQEEDAAVEYLRNTLLWQGAYSEYGVYSGKKRYTMSAELPYTAGIEKGIDVGSKIRFSMPNKTWDGAVEGFHSGIVTAVSETVGVSQPVMKFTAEMLGENLSGSDVTVIVKGTDSDTHIVKGTDSDTHIVKGAV